VVAASAGDSGAASLSAFEESSDSFRFGDTEVLAATVKIAASFLADFGASSFSSIEESSDPFFSFGDTAVLAVTASSAGDSGAASLSAFEESSDSFRFGDTEVLAATAVSLASFSASSFSSFEESSDPFRFNDTEVAVVAATALSSFGFGVASSSPLGSSRLVGGLRGMVPTYPSIYLELNSSLSQFTIAVSSISMCLSKVVVVVAMQHQQSAWSKEATVFDYRWG
jgi:hypothetical protein